MRVQVPIPCPNPPRLCPACRSWLSTVLYKLTDSSTFKRLLRMMMLPSAIAATGPLGWRLSDRVARSHDSNSLPLVAQLHGQGACPAPRGSNVLCRQLRQLQPISQRDLPLKFPARVCFAASLSDEGGGGGRLAYLYM